jgi:hypothetical protein
MNEACSLSQKHTNLSSSTPLTTSHHAIMKLFVTKAVCLLMLALAVTTTQAVNDGEKIIFNCRVMIHLCYDYVVYVSPPFCFDTSPLTSFYTLLDFLSVKSVPAQSCRDDCYAAFKTCCSATPTSPFGNCNIDQTIHDKCVKALNGCYAKFPKTTDFDVDIEGAVVDEA